MFGVVCMFLVFKLKEINFLILEKLVIYIDRLIMLEELMVSSRGVRILFLGGGRVLFVLFGFGFKIFEEYL